MASQIFHKIRGNANNNRQQHQKKRNSGQQVHFHEEVKRHEYEPSGETEQPKPNIVDQLLEMPFNPPKKGYVMDIHSAASVGTYDLVKQLLVEDCRCVNSKNRHGWTPLMYAAQAGHAEVCKLLLEYGASTEQRNEQGKSAKDLAQDWGHPIPNL